MTITEFILARVEAEESFALSAQAAASIYDEGTVRWHWLRTNGQSSAWEPTLHDPARVLAECEAKRRIMEAIGRDGTSWCSPDRLGLGSMVLETLAAVYADHPDYQPEWKP